MKKSWVIIGICFVLGSCYNDNSQDLYPNVTSCDTSNVTFTNIVNPIIQQSCVKSGCHDGSGSTFALKTYSDVKLKADDGSLVGAISYTPGYSQMPKGLPKLDECAIAQIRTWVRNGAPQN